MKIPVWLYNNPKTTGFHPTTSLVKKLAEVGVLGMKDSSGDYMTMVDWMNEIKLINPDFAFMAGTVGMLQPTYYLGACGCVAGTANGFPELVLDLYKALEDRNVERASELQAKVIAVRKYQQVTGFRPSGCHPILRWRGIDPGTVRKPWREPDKRECESMRSGLQEIGVP